VSNEIPADPTCPTPYLSGDAGPFTLPPGQGGDAIIHDQQSHPKTSPPRSLISVAPCSRRFPGRPRGAIKQGDYRLEGLALAAGGH